VKNDVYEMVLLEFSIVFGSFTELSSGNGARFNSSKKGKVTVYHANIAPGNNAEIAFEVDSIGKRFHMTPAMATAFVHQMKASTGCAVAINPQFNWPRIGIASRDHLDMVLAGLRKNIEP
jgi:hypothetical protein